MTSLSIHSPFQAFLCDALTVLQQPFSFANRSTAQPVDGFNLVTTRADFLALEADWNALFERSGQSDQLFQTFNWLWHWQNHFLDEASSKTSLAILTVRREGRLVMVWPLVREQQGPITRLAWMGAPVSQYGDVLCESLPDQGALLEQAWHFLIAHSGASLIHLRKVRDSSVIVPLLARHEASVLVSFVAPSMRLAEGSARAKAPRDNGSTRRKNRSRQRRRMEERGETLLETHVSGARARRLAEHAVLLKRAWLAKRGLLSPAIEDDRTTAFFADVCEGQSHGAGSVVSALTCAGEIAAIKIGFRCKGRLAVHVITYDASYEKVAAGAMLMDDCVHWAIENGLETFDLLGPGDAFKREWAKECTHVRDYAAPFTGAGYLYTALHLGVVHTHGKAAIEALPRDMRRHLIDTLAYTKRSLRDQVERLKRLPMLF